MKRTLSLIIAMLVLCSVFVFPISAQAASKDDIVAAIKATKLAPYFTVAAENSIRLITVSSKQGDKLVQIIKDVDGIVSADLGPSAHAYPKSERDAVMKKLAEACAVLNFSYKVKSSTDQKHESDIVIYIYDKKGQLVGTFDGDLWYSEQGNWVPNENYRPGAETAFAGGFIDFNTLCIGGVVILLAAIAFVALRKTRASVEA